MTVKRKRIAAVLILAVVLTLTALAGLGRSQPRRVDDRSAWVARCVHRATGAVRARTAVCEAMYQDKLVREHQGH